MINTQYAGLEFPPPPEWRTTNTEMYDKILRRLRDAVKREHSEKWARNSWFLLHNAPVHRSLVVKKYLAKLNVTALEHQPYSPQLSLVDFFLFPRLKSVFKGQHFACAEGVAAKAWRTLTEA
jgi:hypothetical protein